jgi:hypothetical protein
MNIEITSASNFKVNAIIIKDNKEINCLISLNKKLEIEKIQASGDVSIDHFSEKEKEQYTLEIQEFIKEQSAKIYSYDDLGCFYRVKNTVLEYHPMEQDSNELKDDMWSEVEFEPRNPTKMLISNYFNYNFDYFY